MTDANNPAHSSHTDRLLSAFAAELDVYIAHCVREQTNSYLAQIESLKKENEHLRSNSGTANAELGDEALKAIWSYVQKPGVADTKVIPLANREEEYVFFLFELDRKITDRRITSKLAGPIAIHVLSVMENHLGWENENYNHIVNKSKIYETVTNFGADIGKILPVLDDLATISHCSSERIKVKQGIQAHIERLKREREERAAKQRDQDTQRAAAGPKISR